MDKQGGGKWALFVEPVGGGNASMALLRPGPKPLPGPGPPEQPAPLAEIETWLRRWCDKEKDKDGPCVHRIVFRPGKVPIEQTLKSLHAVLHTHSLAAKPPPVDFQLSCAFAPYPSRQDIVKGPWGPRTPDGPCF